MNQITLAPKNLPVNWNLERPDRLIRLPYRGGGVVDFEAKALQSFEGHAFFVNDSTEVPAEFAGFEIEAPGNPVQSTVGKGGLFYFENLPAGTYPARIFWKARECRFTIRIPRSDEIRVDLGKISCR